MSKLGLDKNLISKARNSARNVALDVQAFIDDHTTVAVERTVCRLLGIDGVNSVEVPLPNVVVDHLVENKLLPMGAAFMLGNGMLELSLSPLEIAKGIDNGEIDLSKLKIHSSKEIEEIIAPVAKSMAERIQLNVDKRNEYLDK